MLYGIEVTYEHQLEDGHMMKNISVSPVLRKSKNDALAEAIETAMTFLENSLDDKGEIILLDRYRFMLKVDDTFTVYYDIIEFSVE